MYYIRLPLDYINMSADALYIWPVVCKPTEFVNRFWNSYSTYEARNVFPDDDHDFLFKQWIHFDIITFLLSVYNFISLIYLSFKVHCTNKTKIYSINIYVFIPRFLLYTTKRTEIWSQYVPIFCPQIFLYTTIQVFW
jgi:hypothetical protein